MTLGFGRNLNVANQVQKIARARISVTAYASRKMRRQEQKLTGKGRRHESPAGLKPS
jgi:hypothetical protein